MSVFLVLFKLDNLHKTSDPIGMGKADLRKAKRFEEVAKVSVPNLSQFSGVLVDVSKIGCRIHFNVFLNIEMDMEYEILIFPVLADIDSFTLVGEPVWVQNKSKSTEIGFKFLRSVGTKPFEAYIDNLEDREKKTFWEERL
jgi:hypothetical protein